MKTGVITGFSSRSEVSLVCYDHVGLVCMRCILEGGGAVDIHLKTDEVADAHVARHVEQKHKGAVEARAKLALARVDSWRPVVDALAATVKKVAVELVPYGFPTRDGRDPGAWISQKDLRRLEGVLELLQKARERDLVPSEPVPADPPAFRLKVLEAQDLTAELKARGLAAPESDSTETKNDSKESA